MTVTINRAISSAPLATDWQEGAPAGKSPRDVKTLQQLTSPLLFSAQERGAPLSQLAVPTAAASSVSRQEANAALANIQNAMPKPAANDPAFSLTIATMERVPMEAMFLASTLLANQILGDVAAKKGEALSIMSDKQDRLRQKEVEQIREQMEAAVEQQDKAKKAGIFAAVLDWVVAAVDVVVGVAKLVGGAMTANPMMIAGGAMSLAAGAAGVVKALANTLALVDPENADTYKKMAQIAGYIEMSCSLAGAAIDITSAIRNAVVSKVVPKVAAQVMKETGGEALTAAIKQGSKEAIGTAASEIGKKVAAQAAEQIATRLALEAAEAAGKSMVKKAIQKFGVDGMAKAFSREAIEAMVTKAVKEVGEEALKSGTKVTAEEISKKVVAEINKAVIAAAMKASVVVASTVGAVTRSAVTGAQNVGLGIIEKEKAQLQKKIDQLVLDQQWTQSFFEFFEASKKESTKKIRDLQEGQADVIQGGTQMISQIASNQAQMAASMV